MYIQKNERVIPDLRKGSFFIYSADVFELKKEDDVFVLYKYVDK